MRDSEKISRNPMQTSTDTTTNDNPQARWLRTAALIWGVLTFLWLAPEDDSVLPVLLLGFSVSVLMVAWLVIRLNAAPWMHSWGALLAAAVFGALIGAGTSLSTVLLLLFKNARHAHLYPDYPPEILLETLARFPVWALAGGLIGIGLVCLRWVLQSHK
jgi:hypothetical protein